MDNPNNIIWSWDLGKFRNPSKIIPYLLLSNGDLILGRYETKGIYRIDKYGKIIWQNDQYNHHWISHDDENLYVPGTIFINQDDLKDKFFLYRHRNMFLLKYPLYRRYSRTRSRKKYHGDHFLLNIL